MPIKLNVSKEGDSGWQKEHVFDKEQVLIGRELNCDLQLEGIKSVVSRKHALIKQTDSGFQIEDLNSRNCTYLNDEKLKPGIAFDLKSGDIIHICDFYLKFDVERQETRYVEKTILDSPNPFLRQAAQFVSLLSQISQDFDRETVDRKEEALKEAFQEFSSDLKNHIAVQVITRSFGAPSEKTSDTQDEVAGPVEIPAGQSSDSMDIVLNLFLKLIQARRQFRMEFIGETMIKTSKTFSIYSCTLDEFKDWLFAPSVPIQERQNRMQRIMKMGNELMVHQISLLDGYKSSVSDGTRKFLEKLDPKAIQQHLRNKKINLGPLRIPYGSLPVLGALLFRRAYSDLYKELAREDQSIIEKKYFRPSYVKRYNKRMDAAEREGSKQKS
jgi:hypothetical protein